jgi:hypothetical protein
VIPLNDLQIDDTGRKVVFPNIKNKFRFVTVSLLLASLVTVVSGASAEPDPDFISPRTGSDLAFTVDVTSCSEGGFFAYWTPSITSDLRVEVEAGGSSTVTALTGLTDGVTNCVDELRNVSGYVDGTLSITNPDPSGPAILDPDPMSVPQMTCGPGCAARDMGSGDLLDSVTMTFDVNPLAVSGNYPGVITLTWTPDGF